MLSDHDSSAIVAVSDLERARRFYSDVLGLELASDGSDGMPLVYRTGSTMLTVYASEEAGTNRANAVCWGVGDDLDAIVAALKANGAWFEHYPHIGRLDGNVHVADAPDRRSQARLVWLKDPDGNILHLNNLPMP
jgi:catechol 2,3-dioxygenase-like lactoylglutathione lyase family enzyme